VFFAVPSRTVSPAHARIERDGATFWIVDLGSRNGTRVNGVLVDRAPLEDGDLVETASAVFVFREGLETPSDLPADRTWDDVRTELPGFRTFIPALEHGFTQLKRVSLSSMPVLLLGATGAGKEVLARAVHGASGRNGSFVAVNCSALPSALVEGMLFGHVKGSFSGALRDEPGFVRAADGGTLVLDEIADLPPAAQGTLLRVLQEGEVVPLGATRPIQVDVRVIAMTHKPLEEHVHAGRFRADLFARLCGFRHHLPTLAARREDIGIFVADALGEPARDANERPPLLAPDVARALLRYEWPYNIRELRQSLGAARAVSPDGVIAAEDLPRTVAGSAGEVRPAAVSETRILTARDCSARDELRRLLAEHNGNVAAVARAMAKASPQIYRWMRRYGIDPAAFRDAGAESRGDAHGAAR
jgi:DNA-binding NtrC family response regulator